MSVRFSKSYYSVTTKMSPRLTPSLTEAERAERLVAWKAANKLLNAHPLGRKRFRTREAAVKALDKAGNVFDAQTRKWLEVAEMSDIVFF